jgi:hypothetical protein
LDYRFGKAFDVRVTRNVAFHGQTATAERHDLGMGLLEARLVEIRYGDVGSRTS